MSPSCPRCDLRFERVPGQWLGSWFLNLCLSQAVGVAIVLVGAIVSFPQPPLVPLLVVGLSAMIIIPIWFFPYSRMIWLAIDLAMRPLEFHEGVAPGFELAALEPLEAP